MMTHIIYFLERPGRENVVGFNDMTDFIPKALKKKEVGLHG